MTYFLRLSFVTVSGATITVHNLSLLKCVHLLITRHENVTFVVDYSAVTITTDDGTSKFWSMMHAIL